MNNKTYVRIGRKFVPIPKKEDVVGKWYNITSSDTPYRFLSEEDLGEETTGIVVDIKDNYLIIALKGAVKRTIKEMHCDCIDNNMYIPEIGDLLNAEKHLRKLYKNYPMHIWSNTKFCRQGSSYSYLCCLNLLSGYCYVDFNYVGSGYHLFAQMFVAKPICEILDKYEYIKIK